MAGAIRKEKKLEAKGDMSKWREEKEREASKKLPSKLLEKVCCVIQDTGFSGSAEEYVQQFYGKPFSELTVCEAEMIVRTLGNKPGCLAEPETNTQI